MAKGPGVQLSGGGRGPKEHREQSGCMCLLGGPGSRGGKRALGTRAAEVAKVPRVSDLKLKVPPKQGNK